MKERGREKTIIRAAGAILPTSRDLYCRYYFLVYLLISAMYLCIGECREGEGGRVYSAGCPPIKHPQHSSQFSCFKITPPWLKRDLGTLLRSFTYTCMSNDAVSPLSSYFWDHLYFEWCWKSTVHCPHKDRHSKVILNPIKVYSNFNSLLFYIYSFTTLLLPHSLHYSSSLSISFSLFLSVITFHLWNPFFQYNNK